MAVYSRHKLGEPFRVMELFPTIQGEGSDIGRETIFMRLYGCNLACVWCDTAHSWDEAKYYKGIYQDYSDFDIVSTVKEIAEAQDIKHMVITGGEPLMHNHEALANLIEVLRLENVIHHVTFETNGTILAHPKLAEVTGLFSVSPKLSSSQNKPYVAKLLSKWIDRAGDKIQFKFVVANKQDADEVVQLIKEADDERLKEVPIIFQPEESANNYRELPSLIRQAFREAEMDKLEYDIRFIPQVHKLYGIR